MRTLLLALSLLPATLLAQSPGQSLQAPGAHRWPIGGMGLLQRPGLELPGGSKNLHDLGALPRQVAMPWPQGSAGQPWPGGPKDGLQVYRLDSVTEGYGDEGYYTTLQYDEQGRVLLEIAYAYDIVSEQYEQINKYEYSYENIIDYNMVTVIAYDWNQDVLDWVLISGFRRVNIFDGNGVLMMYHELELDVDNAEWKDLSRYSLSYDLQGQWIEQVGEVYQEYQWIPYIRYQASRNSNGEISQWLSNDWQSNSWQQLSRTNYTYDGNGALNYWVRECHTCNGQDTGYTVLRFQNRVLDGSGNWFQHLTYRINDGDTIPESIREFMYDVNVDHNELQLPTLVNYRLYDEEFHDFEAERAFRNKLDTEIISYYNSLSEEWESYTANYFYSLVTLSSVPEQNGLGEWQLYPNPAQDVLHLQGPVMGGTVLTLRDLQGRTVLQQQVASAETISLAGLSAGLYTYTLQAGRHMRHGKLLKN